MGQIIQKALSGKNQRMKPNLCTGPGLNAEAMGMNNIGLELLVRPREAALEGAKGCLLIPVAVPSNSQEVVICTRWPLIGIG